MTPQPPPLAERLLRWSLSPGDRQAVLGDLQEEFAAIDAATNRAAANRWYWTQTLTSVGPNAVRRVRYAWGERRRTVNDDDRQRRRSNRIAGLWFGGIGTVLGALLWWLSRDPVTAVFGSPFVAIGLSYIAISYFRTNPRRLRSQSQRNLIQCLCVLVSSARSSFLLPRETIYVAGVVVLVSYLWPERYWPFLGRDRRPREYWIRTPALVLGSGRNGSVYNLASVPAVWLAMSPPILGRATGATAPADDASGVTPMNITIARRFTSSETLRLYSALNAKPEDVRATLEIHDASDRIVATMPAPVSPATLQQRPYWSGTFEFEETKPSDVAADPPALSGIDVTISLAALTPGSYTLRLNADDGILTNHQDTKIVIDRHTRGRS